MKVINYISICLICLSCFSNKKSAKNNKKSNNICTSSKLVLSKYTYPLPEDSLTINSLLKIKGSDYIKDNNDIITINVLSSTFSFFKNEYKEFLIYSVIKDSIFIFHNDIKVGINVDKLALTNLVKCDTIFLENDEYTSYTSLVLDKNYNIKTIVYENFYE